MSSSSRTDGARRRSPSRPRLGRGVLVALLVAPALSAQAGDPADGAGIDVLEFRTIDGTGNNRLHDAWGSAMTPLRRMTTVGYADGESAPAGQDRPSAREVSNAVVAQPGGLPALSPVSDFVWQWGQFLDHDLDLTGGMSPAEPFDIEVPSGDPWFDPLATGEKVIGLSRSQWTLVDGSPVRQQVNQITAFIDASNVYGSDPVRAEALRLPDGRLKTSAGDLLPFNVDGLPNAPSPDPGFFLAGDERANEQNGLTAMHTLFVREHNTLVDLLAGASIPEELHYDIARALVGAEMQAITYREFLPRILGPDALPPYTGYDPSVDPSVANIFSTACYRFGHTMLSPTLQRLGPDMQPIAAGHIELRDAFFNPQAIIDHGIEPLLRGLAMQRPQEVDGMIVDDVRNFLFGPPGSGGFDLASLNIQRGRDHGLPGYNQARVDFGLAPAATFADVSSDPEVQARLASVYDTPDDIDVWVGMLAEDHVSGAIVGELAHAVLVDQFTRVRDGDRFWYEIALPPLAVEFIESRTLSVIIRSNTSIGDELPEHAFIQAWRDLGQGLAGALGEPRLSAQGSLLPRSLVTVTLHDAPAGAPAFVAFGLAALEAPFKGGTMMPAITPPFGLVASFVTGGAGDAHFEGRWPGAAPPGTTIYMQCWIADGGAPQGVAASNALRGDSP